MNSLLISPTKCRWKKVYNEGRISRLYNAMMHLVSADRVNTANATIWIPSGDKGSFSSLSEALMHPTSTDRVNTVHENIWRQIHHWDVIWTHFPSRQRSVVERRFTTKEVYRLTNALMHPISDRLCTAHATIWRPIHHSDVIWSQLSSRQWSVDKRRFTTGRRRSIAPVQRFGASRFHIPYMRTLEDRFSIKIDSSYCAELRSVESFSKSWWRELN